MERVEILAASLFVLRTRQLSATCWCCDVWEKHPDHAPHESEETFCSKISAKANSRRSRWP